MALHIIKLVVGVNDLDDYALRQEAELVDLEGQAAFACWTRFMPKRADEILKTGGSIYRVIKNRIVCRHRILGFDMAEIEGEGRFCRIMQDPEIIETVNMPHRPFQGWRYFDETKVPKDKGIYVPGSYEEIDPQMEENLRAAGLL